MKHPIVITSEGKIYNRGKWNPIYDLYNKIFSNTAGRHKLAQSIIEPLKKRLDYQSIARKTFLVQQLPQGAVPFYTKDPVVSDIVVGRYKYDVIKINSDGRIYRKGRLPGGVRRVTFPTFELYSNPSIKISNVKRRRFDLIDRHIQKAKQ